MQTQTALRIRSLCGFDVHKDNLFISTLKENREKIKERSGSYASEPDGVNKLLVYYSVKTMSLWNFRP